jgi:hypothetical protein
MRLYNKIGIVCGAGITFLLTAQADTLRLRDGRVMTGQFLGANRYEIRFQRDDGGLARVDVSNVDSISFDNGGSNRSGYGPNATYNGPNTPYNAQPGYGNPQPGRAPYGAYAPPGQYNGGNPSSVYNNWPNGTTMPNRSATDRAYTDPGYDSRNYRNPDYGYSERSRTPAPADNYPPPPSNDSTRPDDAYPPQARTQTMPAQSVNGISSPSNYLIPAGSTIVVRTIDPIECDASRVGTTYPASLDQPLVINGRTVAPEGSDATLQVVRVNPGGPFAGHEEIGIALVSLTADGRTYDLNTGAETVQAQPNRGHQSAESIGGGAILGAIIGAVAGGGPGAAIGAGVGAAAGAGFQILRGRNIKVPGETRLAFTLAHDVTL